MSNNNNHQQMLKLPPISSMDPSGSWGIKSPDSISSALPTPPQQERQWKSPPYHHSVEFNRDISFTCHQQHTLPIMQPPNQHQKIEQDINTVVQQCHTLSDNIMLNKNEFINSQLHNNNVLDDMIQSANEVLNALLRLRKHQILVNAHETSPMEQYSSDNASNGEPSRETNTSQSKPTVARQRRRGKRPAFQGRCHSCNISETPEWRRGPDGARTLCNACGLHYAKLARKQQEQTR